MAVRSDEAVSLQEARGRWSQREEELRREIAEAEMRLRGQEAEYAEAISSASQGTQPLLRQALLSMHGDMVSGSARDLLL